MEKGGVLSQGLLTGLENESVCRIRLETMWNSREEPGPELDAP